MQLSMSELRCFGRPIFSSIEFLLVVHAVLLQLELGFRKVSLYPSPHSHSSLDFCSFVAITVERLDIC